MKIENVHILDLLVIVILTVSVVIGYKKGLLKSIFNLFSFIIALIISKTFYPHIAKFLTDTFIYSNITQTVKKTLNLSSIVEAQTLKAQTQLINSLSLPNFITNSLIANNNPELYKIFKISHIEDYIANYIGALIINIIAIIITFIISLMIINIISKFLNIINYIPVIKHFNKLGGAVSGFAIGVLVIWVLFTLMTIFFIKPPFSNTIALFPYTKIAKIFYNNNIIINMLREMNFYP